MQGLSQLTLKRTSTRLTPAIDVEAAQDPTETSHLLGKTKKINAKKLLIALSLIPALVDGVGYFVLSFSQLLTFLYSAEIIEANPANLSNYRYFLPISVLPFFAGLGILALGYHENKETIDEHFPETNQLKLVQLNNHQLKLKG